MPEHHDTLDERLHEYGARWRAAEPDLRELEYPLPGIPGGSARPRGQVWLAAAAIVAIVLGGAIWATRLLDGSDQEPGQSIDQTPASVPWAALDPTHPTFSAEAQGSYSTLSVTGDLDLQGEPDRTVSFAVTFTSERDLSLAPCPDFTITERFSADDETSETHALNCAAVPFKNSAGDPYLPAGRPVTFQMQLPGSSGNVPKITWELENPGTVTVLSGQLIVDTTAPTSRSGYCATLRFKGQEFELSDSQFGEGQGQGLGAAEGQHCGDRSTTELQAARMSEEVGSDVLVISYPNGFLNYVRTGDTELTPVPYPEVILTSTGDVGEADVGLARRFAQFAVTPTTRLRDLIGFSTDGVSLRLGASSRQIQPAALAEETSWTLQANGFAGRDGDLNALEPLREHLLGRLHPFTRSDGNLTVSEGDHERCTGPAITTPSDLAGLRHLAIQPAPNSYGSCLDWFSIDLYLDPDGAVSAVLLDLWEP